MRVPVIAFALMSAVVLIAAPFQLAHAAAPAPAAGNPVITINAAAPRTRVSPELYGIFFEEISHAGEGGLYAEMVQNRDMEANTIPDGWKVDGRTLTTPMGWKTELWFNEDLPGWSLVKEGDAEGSIAQDSATPLNPRNPHSLKFTSTKVAMSNGSTPGRIGVANSGFWGMNVKDGESYDGTFYGRTQGEAVGLTFALESSDGKKTYAQGTVSAVGGGNSWRKYSFNLQARGADPKARLAIYPTAPGTLWLDCVSLFPRNTFKGHGLRPDLAQMIVDLKPAFVRFPGGCIVEGVSLHNRIRWQDSIGDISQRQGDYELWGYYNTYGLGFHEFLQFCEDLGAAPMYVVNAGMSCQLRRPYELALDTDLHIYIEDTLNALEYAMGPATSKFGAMRAANGHPAPFKIKYVEIGNENWGANYEQHHYRAFYDAIKAKYPEVITIADTRAINQPIEIVDDHYYVPPQRFFDLSTLYDNTDRKGPKVYIGEYAVNREVGTGNLLGALAEAVFMLNLEKNSDVVTMCSYAPLFENVNKRDWPVNLIRFDSSQVIGRSSYYVQQLFGANRPDVILKTDVQSAKIPLLSTQVQQVYALAGLDEQKHDLVIKVVNPTPTKTTTHVAIQGLANVGKTMHVTTLSNADVKAENTLENPKAVAPVESDQPVAGLNFSYDFPANSLTILRIPAQ